MPAPSLLSPAPALQFDGNTMCALTFWPVYRRSPPKFQAAHWFRLRRMFR